VEVTENACRILVGKFHENYLSLIGQEVYVKLIINLILKHIFGCEQFCSEVVQISLQ